LRRWSARTTEAQLPKYLEHFSKSVVPELRRVPGYLGANVSLRRPEGEVEIVVETNWRSLESIRAFAGSDVEAAVVPDQAAALLTSFDRRVCHSEIVLTDRV
jgi:heme-degrading monooxygenase HmoA